MTTMTEAVIGKGSVLVVLQANIAAGTDLTRLKALLQGTEEVQLEVNRRMPTGFGFDPAPLRTHLPLNFPHICDREPKAEVEVTFYATGILEFGIVFVLDGMKLADLPKLSQALYAAPEIEAWQMANAKALADEVTDALIKPTGTDEPVAIDDVVFWRIESFGSEVQGAAKEESPTDWEGILQPHLPIIAQVTHGEVKQLSDHRVAKTVRGRHWNSYYDTDRFFSSFYGAWLFGEEDPDITDVYAAVNSMGLEFRAVDEQLDDDLEHAATLLGRNWWRTWWQLRKASRRAIRRYLRATQRFSAVDSALNLSGDLYLSEVAQMALRDLRVREMQKSAKRKLTSFYEVISTLRGERQTSDMNMMEALIILLFVMSNVISLVALGWWPFKLFGWQPLGKS